MVAGKSEFKENFELREKVGGAELGASTGEAAAPGAAVCAASEGTNGICPRHPPPGQDDRATLLHELLLTGSANQGSIPPGTVCLRGVIVTGSGY